MTNTWGTQGEYPPLYENLERFPPKELLDTQIAGLIADYAKREGHDVIFVAELGAGRAPISRLLADQNPQKYNCSAFDINKSMAPTEPVPFPYDSNFDLTSPEIDPRLIGVYDVVVLENAWYTTSMSPGGRNYTKEEAEIMRITSLKKAAAMLRPGGILVLSDPLLNTKDFGVQRIIKFLEYEQQALSTLNRKAKSLLRIFLDKLGDKDIQKILKINKKIMQRSVLLTETEARTMIKDTNLFYDVPLELNSSSYLGSNVTAVYRRNDQEIITEGDSVLGDPIILDGQVHEAILEWVGGFRRKRYMETETTPKLPYVDNHDRKAEGILIVYPSMNKIGLAAVASFQGRGEMGLDIEELMAPPGGDFYTHLTQEVIAISDIANQRVSSGKPLTFGEIRRLATDRMTLDSSYTYFQNMYDICLRYAKKMGIDIVTFLSDERRKNAFVRLNKKAKFHQAEGFTLVRNNPRLQTIMIPAYRYFFKDDENILSPQDHQLLNELTALLTNGCIWSEVIKGHQKEVEFRNVVHRLFNDTETNVNIYFTTEALL